MKLDAVPLLATYPGADTVEPLRPTSGWRTWCGGESSDLLKGACAATMLAASAIVRLQDYGRVVNSLSTVGAGIGLQSLVNLCTENGYASRVQQFSQSVAGGNTLYLVSQLAINNIIAKGPGIVVGGCMLGANAALWAKQLIDKRFGLQVDDAPSNALENKGPKLQCFTFSLRSKVHCPLKWVTAAACALACIRYKDSPDYRGLAAWGASYFAFEPVGQFGVKVADLGAQRGWRIFKTCINTFSYVAVPCLLFPWDKQGTTRAFVQLSVVGAFMGLFGGFLYRTQENELRKTDIDLISALKSRPPVENLAFKVWRISWPVLIFASTTAFTISQWASGKVEDRLAMGTMYAGYLYTFAKALAINRYWNLDSRCKKQHLTLWDRFVDGRVVSQIIPRMVGINPVHLSYALTNSIPMQSGQSLDFPHQILYCFAWFCLGKGMASEFVQTMGDNQGTAVRSTTMLFISAMMAQYFYMNPQEVPK
ncbi:MAG TPA: hypothetical protein VLF94_05815 [Chlamydiales bacterium]|nr:hypothetical protein [Chlamydiales bacterium]